MNWKKLLLAALVVFILFQVTDFIIHVKMLEGIYQPLRDEGVFRSLDDMNSYMWVMFLMGIIFSFFFTYIFAMGHQNKGCLEGLRYGIIIGFFVFFVNSYSSFVIYPFPYKLVWYWIISGFIQTILAGIACSLIYKPKE